MGCFDFLSLRSKPLTQPSLGEALVQPYRRGLGAQVGLALIHDLLA